MPDRSLVGLLAIALVIATVLTAITFQVKEEEHIRFLARQTPEIMQCGTKDEMYHSFDFMVTEDLPDVVIRCGFLYRPPDRLPWQPWGEVGPGQKEVVTQFLDRLQEEGTEIYDVYEIVEDSGARLEIIDFTDSMAILVGEDLVKEYNTIYALLTDQDGSISFYRGVRDFFFERDHGIIQIECSRRNESTTYSSEATGEPGEGPRPVSDAPIGKIHLQDLTAGEKVHVEVAVTGERMPCHHGVMRIIRVDTGYGQGPLLIDKVGYTEIPEDKG